MTEATTTLTRAAHGKLIGFRSITYQFGSRSGVEVIL